MGLDYQSIGGRIKIARIRANMSQEALAEKSNLSVVHISNIENGHTKLSLEAVVNIANALSLTPNDFLCDNLVYAYQVYNREAQELYADCSTAESRVLVDITKSAKSALRKNQYLLENLLVRKED